MHAKADAPKLTVWYNSKCPVGNVGIERQHNRLARARAGAIEFRGIDLALARSPASVEHV